MVREHVRRIVTLKFEGGSVTHITASNDTGRIVSQIACMCVLEQRIVVIVQSLQNPKKCKQRRKDNV